MLAAFSNTNTDPNQPDARELQTRHVEAGTGGNETQRESMGIGNGPAQTPQPTVSPDGAARLFELVKRARV